MKPIQTIEPAAEVLAELAQMLGHAIQLGRTLVCLVVMYLGAQVLGLVSWHGGEAMRHYQMRGTPFPVENGQQVLPEDLARLQEMLDDMRAGRPQPIPPAFFGM